MRRFGTDRIKTMIQNLGVDETQAIRSKMFSNSIESAQKKVEGNNFDTRKSLLDYDDVMNEQREIIYARRNEILDSEDIHNRVLETFNNNIHNLVESHIAPEGYLTENDLSEICEYLNTNLLKKTKILTKDLNNLKEQEVEETIIKKVEKDYDEKTKEIPAEVRNEFEKAISLRVIDTSWVDHISAMEHLREGIGLRGWSGANPLQAYTLEGFDAFEKMMDEVDSKISVFLLKAEVNQNAERKQTIKGTTNDGKEKIKSTPKRINKIGRNDTCPCASGKKYKNCCGR